MPSWPATLPGALLGSYQETRPDNVLRSQTEVGPGITRRRTIANVTKIQFDLMLTKSQMTTLESFYDNDLASGALSFDMNLPRDPLVSARFRFTAPLSTKPVSSTLYTVSLQLEKLP